MRIRNLGNHEHNNLVIRSGAGELVVVSRPTGDTDHQPQDYTPCPHCYGWYSRRDLWKHDAERYVWHKSRNEHSLPAPKHGELMKAPPHSSTEKFKHILAAMRVDTVNLTIENDRMLNIMGERLFEKHGYQESAHQLIRSNLRDIAKLIIELQKTTNIKSSEEAVNPALFTNILLAARNLCGQDLTTGIVKHPAKGLKLGTRSQAPNWEHSLRTAGTPVPQNCKSWIWSGYTCIYVKGSGRK